MEIIEEGKTDYTARCFECGCRFNYNIKETHYEKESYGNRVFVNCPCCGYPVKHWYEKALRSDDDRDI